MNKHVQDTVDQIENTLETLSLLGLATTTRKVNAQNISGNEILTWSNHVSSRDNAGASFNTLNQYFHIYETGAYHCILFDGSIIRAYFKFQENKLLEESLLYWPAPVKFSSEDVERLGIREVVADIIGNDYCNNEIGKHIKMRSPFRYDFDSSNDTEKHPATHIHLQHHECRIGARSPICFNTFVKFIFSNFYPDIQSDYIRKLSILHYSTKIQPFDQAIFRI